LVFISVTGKANPTAIVRLEELGQLKNPTTSTGIEHVTFRLVTEYLSELRYYVPLDELTSIIKLK
jgi:hypothetical protein